MRRIPAALEEKQQELCKASTWTLSEGGFILFSFVYSADSIPDRVGATSSVRLRENQHSYDGQSSLLYSTTITLNV